MRIQFMCWILAAGPGVAALAGCSADPPVVTQSDSQSTIVVPPPIVGKKYGSPEDVFAAYQAAAKVGDFVEAAKCTSRESQTLMAGSIILTAIHTGERDETVREELETLFQRFSIDHAAKLPEDLDVRDNVAMMKWAAEPVVDKPACIGSLYDFFKARGQMSGSAPLSIGKLEDLKIDGDRATAVVVEPKRVSPLEFVNEHGSWRVQFPKEVMAAGR